MSRLVSMFLLWLLLLHAAAPASAVMDVQPRNCTWELPASSYDLAPDVRDGPNLYAYVQQNPWTKFDPHGLSEEEIQAINRTVDAKVKDLGFVGRVMSWVGADKALKSSLGTANERYNANAAAGKGRTLSTGEYIGGIAEGSAPAITIAAMAPAAAAGPLVLAKEGVAEATGLPIGVDDLVKVAKNAPDLVSSAKKIAQGADEAVEAAKDLRRPYIRKDTRKAVEDAAPRTPDGRPIDPNTLKPIDGTPDMGHKPGNEHWREAKKAKEEGLDQKQFNDRMNDPSKYQLEDPSSNRSRKHEKKD